MTWGVRAALALDPSLNLWVYLKYPGADYNEWVNVGLPLFGTTYSHVFNKYICAASIKEPTWIPA